MVTAEADKTLLIPSHRAGVDIFLIDRDPPLSAEGRAVTAEADKADADNDTSIPITHT